MGISSSYTSASLSPPPLQLRRSRHLAQQSEQVRRLLRTDNFRPWAPRCSRSLSTESDGSLGSEAPPTSEGNMEPFQYLDLLSELGEASSAPITTVAQTTSARATQVQATNVMPPPSANSTLSNVGPHTLSAQNEAEDIRMGKRPRVSGGVPSGTASRLPGHPWHPDPNPIDGQLLDTDSIMADGFVSLYASRALALPPDMERHALGSLKDNLIGAVQASAVAIQKVRTALHKAEDLHDRQKSASRDLCSMIAQFNEATARAQAAEDDAGRARVKLTQMKSKLQASDLELETARAEVESSRSALHLAEEDRDQLNQRNQELLGQIGSIRQATFLEVSEVYRGQMWAAIPKLKQVDWGDALNSLNVAANSSLRRYNYADRLPLPVVVPPISSYLPPLLPLSPSTDDTIVLDSKKCDIGGGVADELGEADQNGVEQLGVEADQNQAATGNLGVDN